MAIVLDAVSSADNAPTVSKSLSWAHTVGAGSDRLLIVGVSSYSSSVPTVTYGGVAMTRVGGIVSATYVRASLYVLINPLTGTANVAVSHTTDSWIVGGGSSWTGVDQTTPMGTLAAATGSNATPKVQVASAAGDLVHDVVSGEASSAASLTVGAGQTVQWNRNALISDYYHVGGGSTEPGAGSVTMSWSRGTSGAWAIVAVPIKTAAATVVTVALTGASAAESATAATLALRQPLTGASAATAVSAASLRLTQPLAATSAASSASAASLRLTVPVSGASAAASATLATITVRQPLTGSSVGTSVTASTLAVSGQVAIAGTSVATSATALTIRLAVPLSGASVATSVTTGTMTTTLASASLSAASLATSATSGTLALAVRLTATSLATAETAGTVTPFLVSNVEGVSTADAETFAALSLFVPLVYSGLSGKIVEAKRPSGTLATRSVVQGHLRSDRVVTGKMGHE